jgi:glycosyltransferase involved in cell wall biosynthesis
MRILYTAPTRAHHYHYARILNKYGFLHRFVCGFPRWPQKSKIPELNGKVIRADFFQSLFLISLKISLHPRISKTLAFWAKIEQDIHCFFNLSKTDIFIFYNGSGRLTAQKAKRQGKIVIAEAVNAHIEYQERILKEEHSVCNVPFIPEHRREKARRIKEYEIADYIIVPSEFARRTFIEEGVPSEKLILINYGFTPFKEKQLSPKQPSDEFRILFVGSISIRKGVRYLYQAFKKLQHPNKKLILVGPKTQHTGLEEFEDFDNVEFTGILKGEELAKQYERATVFCLPSVEDGFGLVLGEALSYGLPIIATCNTGGYDIITNNKEGFIIPIRDPNSILEKLTILSSDFTMLDQMSKNALRKAKLLNGWQYNEDQLIRAISNLWNKATDVNTTP